MAMHAQQTVVGVFNDRGLADTAVDELQNAGFTADQIYYSGSGGDEKEYFDTAFWREVRKHLFYGKAVSHDDLTRQLKTLGLSLQARQGTNREGILTRLYFACM